MSRERMVTRTVEMSNVHFMTLNVETAEVSIIDRYIPGKVDVEGALNYAHKVFEPLNPFVKFVAVRDGIDHFEVLYGMPESEFIARAKVLPPRTTTK